MIHHSINCEQDLDDLISYVDKKGYKRVSIKTSKYMHNLQFEDSEDFTLPDYNYPDSLRTKVIDWIDTIRERSELHRIVFGKNEKTHIVSCEVKDDFIELFMEKNGKVTSEFIVNYNWIVSSKRIDASWQTLDGGLHYQYVKMYRGRKQFYLDRMRYKKQYDIFSVLDPKEGAMILNGFTYYKAMKVEDVSVLSFDIETTGLLHNHLSKVLLISNTFVKNGKIERRLFAYDEYETQADLLNSWCEWVRDVNPSIMCGHNVFSFDLPYLAFCAKEAGTALYLGRDGSEIRFDKFNSKFRKDGSQDYDYTRSHVYGREIVDTLFTSYHFDVGRKYESYALKQIIRQEKLEVKDRIFYDASKIKDNYLIPSEWEAIKKYCIFDSDDGFSLYKKMIPAYFYYAQSIPKSFQAINYSATGSQINAFLIRSYLQKGHSLPATTRAERFPGAISMGTPGIYKNVFKVDVVSLYPSIMLQFQIYDPAKDPKKHFLKMVEYFTNERLANKKKYEDFGDAYSKQLSDAQKIVINSAYGLLGAEGLLFNSPDNAALVTEKGREILKTAMLWATSHIEPIYEADVAEW